MDSNLSVIDAQNQFARFNLPPAEFLRRLNRASYRLLNSDVFCDLFTVVQVTTATGYFSVPREFGRAYGSNQCDTPQPIFSQWMPFLQRGFGRFDPQSMHLWGLNDVGAHYPIQQDVWANGARQPGTLRLAINNASDAGQVVRFFGTDPNGVRIYDPVDGSLGLNVTTVSPSVTTSQIFLTVDGVQFPVTATGDGVMTGGSTLSKVIFGTPTQISVYESGETRPMYQHYYGGLGVGGNSSTWWLFLKRKHVFYRTNSPHDWVYPDNLDALEHAFNAMVFKDRQDAKAEDEQWELAKKVLKQEYAAKVPYPEIFAASDDGELMYPKFPRGWVGGRW